MDKNDEKIILYKNLIDKISQFYNEEKIKEFDLKNFSVSRDYKDTSKCVYKENYDFIPQIKLKFNDVKKIDQEIIDSLINECKKLLNEKDVKIIEIKKGSLSIVIALNYLIQDKLQTMNMENKQILEIIDELNNYLGIETLKIKDILKDNLTIAQKDKQFKPDFVEENLYDLETSREKLVNTIIQNKEKNCDTNIYEISKAISADDIKDFFASLDKETKETQDNLYELVLKDVNNELENYLQIFDVQFEEALKNSVFEYNTKYIAYIYRYDENYNSGKLRCKNSKSKILFHGTNSCRISMILAGQFYLSEGPNNAIFGPGVYFSDLLDYT